MEFLNQFLDVLKNKYAQFNGRARRKEFWQYYLVYVILAVIANVIDAIIGKPILGGILSLALIVPTIAAGIRRMHDINHSGWFILIPFYNLYLWAQEGEKGDNQYGADPKVGE